MISGGSFKTLPFLARLIIVLFGAAGLASISFAFWFQPDFSPARVLTLLVVAAGSAGYKAKLCRETTISFLTAVVMIGIITDGPVVSILAAICGVTVQTLPSSTKLAFHRLTFNVGMTAFTVAAAWWTHHTVTAASYSLDTASVEVAATVLASLVYFLASSIAAALIVSTTQRISVAQIWIQYFMHSAPSFVLTGLLALGIMGLMAAHLLLIPIALVIVTSSTYYSALRRAGARIALEGMNDYSTSV